MAGANFFIAVKKLLESKRKIRLASILRHSGISLEDISAEAKAVEFEDCTFSINANDLPPAFDLTLLTCRLDIGLEMGWNLTQF
jgi:hypothetical protein